MGKLKHKPKPRDKSLQNDGAPSSSGIFQTLFGNGADGQTAAASIFSESNPFRRKPQESSGFATAESLCRNNDVVSESSNLDGRNKRDRGLEKNPNPETDSIAETSKTKKSKERKTQKSDLGAEPNGAFDDEVGGNSSLAADSNGGSKKDKARKLQVPNIGNPNFGAGSDGVLNKEEGEAKANGENIDLGTDKNEKKRKRKRDEIEREYETKKYGVAGEDEQGGEKGLKEKKKLAGQKRKTVENVEDLVVSPEGYDDESKLLRTVFVGNLPLKVKKKVLIKEFKQFGEVESVRIRSVPLLDTKRPRKEAIITKQINENVDIVHAYVVFKTEESAQAALSHNMAIVGGNHIRVDRACPPRKKLKGESGSLYDSKRTVFVGNLPYDVKDEELYQLFSSIDKVGSSVEAIRVIRHPHMHLGKGIAYVLLKTREAANLVVRKRNLKLRDRELRVSHAKKDSTTPSKRPNPSAGQTTNSPAKRQAVDPRTPDSHKNTNVKAPMSSYQGLRASKSGVQKKVHTKSIRPSNLNSKSPRVVKKPKERTGKRPAVAARKAKDVKDGGASKRAGMKRKPDKQTPGSFHRNKKAKKFK